MSWPKLIGALAAGVGLSGVLSASALVFDPHGLYGSLGRGDWAALIGFGGLLVLSYPLATGRNWARRLLLFTAVVSGIVVLALQGRMLFAEGSVGHLSREEARPILWEMWFGELSVFVLLLTLSVFVILLLCQRQVVEAFQQRALSHDKSN